jgi:integrase
MAQRVTDKLVKELTEPAAGNQITYDDKVAGFGIRITARGARAFVLNYRNLEGRERRYTIGAYPTWSVERARKRASEIKREIARGDDPQGEKTATRKAPTIADLADLYITEHLPKKRPTSQAEDKAIIAKIIKPKIGNRKVAVISHPDINRLHREISKSTPTRANRIVALLSKMFSLAIKEGWRADNPCRGIERNPEEKRHRYLNPTELGQLTTALNECQDTRAADLVRLCLLTGCRRGEALAATWDQFDLDVGVWIKPGATTKQKTEHRAPLSAAAVTLLTSILEGAVKGEDDAPLSRYVFPGKTADVPLKDVREAWDSIRDAAGIPDVRLHDLRHTYASILASAGLSLPVIGALLGHTQPATTARYTHLFDDPLRKATDIVGAVVTGQKPAEVVPIKEGRGS